MQPLPVLKTTELAVPQSHIRTTVPFYHTHMPKATAYFPPQSGQKAKLTEANNRLETKKNGYGVLYD